MIARNLTQNDKDALAHAMGEFHDTGKVKTVCPRCGRPLIVMEAGTRIYSHCEDTNCIGTMRIGI